MGKLREEGNFIRMLSLIREGRDQVRKMPHKAVGKRTEVSLV